MAMVVLLVEVVLECHKKHATLNSQCALSFMPPIPSKTWGIFTIQRCVCLQAYVKLMKLCSLYKSQNVIPNFCLPPNQMSFHENVFYYIKHHNLEANVFVSKSRAFQTQTICKILQAPLCMTIIVINYSNLSFSLIDIMSTNFFFLGKHSLSL